MFNLTLFSLYIIFILSVVIGKHLSLQEKKGPASAEKYSRIFLILNLVFISGILFQLIVYWSYFASLLLFYALISLFLVYYVLIVPFNGKNAAMKYYMVVIFNFSMVTTLYFASLVLDYLMYVVIIYTLFVSMYNIIEIRYLRIHEILPHM